MGCDFVEDRSLSSFKLLIFGILAIGGRREVFFALYFYIIAK